MVFCRIFGEPWKAQSRKLESGLPTLQSLGIWGRLLQRGARVSCCAGLHSTPHQDELPAFAQPRSALPARCDLLLSFPCRCGLLSAQSTVLPGHAGVGRPGPRLRGRCGVGHILRPGAWIHPAPGLWPRHFKSLEKGPCQIEGSDSIQTLFH